MRRFRFPLARLERLRSHLELLAKRGLAEALALENSLRNQMKIVRENIAACEAQLESAPALGIALVEGLGAVSRRLHMEIELATQQAEIARAAYQKRRRDALSLRRLKEDRYAEWKVEVMKEEQAELEEMARARRYHLEKVKAVQ